MGNTNYTVTIVTGLLLSFIVQILELLYAQHLKILAQNRKQCSFCKAAKLYLRAKATLLEHISLVITLTF